MAEAVRKQDEVGAGIAQGWVGAAQEMTQDATQQVTESAAYVKDRLGSMDDTVRDYTGKPLDEWTEDLKAFIRERPLTSAVLIAGIGFVVGKLLRRW
jgi:ElaB/YqjD/DUF883 family membrane-anchored ribosome-binding protein